jgi:hypothetical protein
MPGQRNGQRAFLPRGCLPTYAECDDAVQYGRATALQRFIYEHAPVDYDGYDCWCADLSAMLVEAVALGIASCDKPKSRCGEQ